MLRHGEIIIYMATEQRTTPCNGVRYEPFLQKDRAKITQLLNGLSLCQRFERKKKLRFEPIYFTPPSSDQPITTAHPCVI